MIDVADSRLAATQRAALRAGRKTGLSYKYKTDGDTLLGATCDGVWFPAAELLLLCTCTH